MYFSKRPFTMEHHCHIGETWGNLSLEILQMISKCFMVWEYFQGRNHILHHLYWLNIIQSFHVGVAISNSKIFQCYFISLGFAVRILNEGVMFTVLFWIFSIVVPLLTLWGRVTHICLGKLINIGSDNGLKPGRRQAIVWTIAGILLIRPLWRNFSEFLIIIHTFSFNKMHLKMPSAKWHPFCLGLNMLTHLPLVPHICLVQIMAFRLFCARLSSKPLLGYC